MTDPTTIPEATAYRLSLYHCLLGELKRSDPGSRIRSREISQRLEIKEETVRRDISFVGNVGRPGSGYDVAELLQAIQTFLGLEDQYPIIRIGSVEMLQALEVVFPPEAYGVKPVAYFSENPGEVGTEINGLMVRHVNEIADLEPELGVTVALVACSPEWVQMVVDLCGKRGLAGVLLLTPKLSVDKPEGMTITQIRMPCDIKSLACRCTPRPAAMIE